MEEIKYKIFYLNHGHLEEYDATLYGEIRFDSMKDAVKFIKVERLVDIDFVILPTICIED